MIYQDAVCAIPILFGSDTVFFATSAVSEFDVPDFSFEFIVVSKIVLIQIFYLSPVPNDLAYRLFREVRIDGYKIY